MTGVASPMDDSVIAGELFSISCMVTGADSLEARFNFELIAEDNSTVIHHQEDASDTQSIHNFSASASDAGKYVCEVTVHSDFLDAPITSMSTAVTLTVQRKPHLCDENNENIAAHYVVWHAFTKL